MVVKLGIIGCSVLVISCCKDDSCWEEDGVSKALVVTSTSVDGELIVRLGSPELRVVTASFAELVGTMMDCVIVDGVTGINVSPIGTELAVASASCPA